MNEEGVPSSDVLYKAVQPLKDRGIRVISVGFGLRRKGSRERQTLASTNDDLYWAGNWAAIKEELLKKLTAGKCPGRVLFKMLF